MAEKAHLFYVEDDVTLSFVTIDNLERAGYRVSHFTDGESARKHYKAGLYNLCILDVMLPNLDGFSLAKRIREQDSHTPIIFLTAKSMQEDKIKGLSLGGDDYILKPYSIEELVLKIEIFLRRSQVNPDKTNAKSILQIGRYELDVQNLKLRIDESACELTYKEAELLRFLFERRDTLLKREEILTAVWGDDSYYLSRSLDVFISRLRKLLNKDNSLRIRSIHGIGFRFETD
jgi:two-component system response regulator VicR